MTAREETAAPAVVEREPITDRTLAAAPRRPGRRQGLARAQSQKALRVRAGPGNLEQAGVRQPEPPREDPLPEALLVLRTRISPSRGLVEDEAKGAPLRGIEAAATVDSRRSCNPGGAHHDAEAVVEVQRRRPGPTRGPLGLCPRSVDAMTLSPRPAVWIPVVVGGQEAPRPKTRRGAVDRQGWQVDVLDPDSTTKGGGPCAACTRPRPRWVQGRCRSP
jgi:hypothetical protein